MTTRKFRVGDGFIVHACLMENFSIETDGLIPIFLGPGRAFGSGDHETTASCLEEMEKLPHLKGSTVLDLGCGTGILAIAAAKLGARRITAVDPEPEAIAATVQNIRLNDVENKVGPILGDISSVKGKTFDLVLANIYGDILMTIAQDLAALLDSRANLILSGIHYDDAFDVKTAYLRHNLSLQKSRALEGYCTFVMSRL